LVLAVASVSTHAQDRSRTESQARRVDDRIRVLEREADQLAGQARTLLGDLRKLEVDRDLQAERLKESESAVAAARTAVQQTTERLTALEQQRVAQLPDLKTQLVDVYKRGRAGYARLLLGVEGVREFGRSIRAVSALVRINEQRLAEHRRTLDAVRQERAALEDKVRELQGREADARRARAAADRAVAARSALITQIDARRDLNAQLAGELQVAYTRLQQQLANLGAGRPVEPVALPLAPFRGAIEWPAAGPVTSRFGRVSGRFGSGASNGIEIGAAEGAAVRAVHPGTVSYAGPFTGFGNLVIVDHGANSQTLYGYLSSVSAEPGQTVDAGVEIGRVGSAPAGPPALYFEVRIDGRSVDPVQWLRPR
jgi:septal ring factor EnvC (AmiA/AmiB activator)